MNALARWVFGSWFVAAMLLVTPVAQAQFDDPPAEAERAPAARPDAGDPEAGLALKPMALPAGEAEAILPRGAVLHVRIKSAGALLDDASAMATKFIPEKALSPEQRKLLDMPNPLLALIGQQATGRPLTIPMLAEQTGIDPARPITLSGYLQSSPEKGFVLTLPVKDLKAMSRMLSGMVRGSEDVELDGGSALHVQIDGADVFLVCSEKTVCACGSPELAQMIISSPAEGKLDKSNLVARALKEHPDDNLLIVADAEPVRPMLGMLRQMSAVPEPMVADLRQQLLGSVPPRDMANINREIRKRLKVRDAEQLMDYCEVLALGTYEALAEHLLAEADNFQGIVLAADLGADLQRFQMTVFSSSIKPEGKPLPLAEAAKSVAKLPGSHNYLMLQGQSPAPAKSKLVASIIDRVSKRAKAKDLPAAFSETLQKAYADYQPEPTLDSKVPWTVTTRALGPKTKGPDQFANLQKYWEHVYSNLGTPLDVVTVQAIPKQPEGFLAAHYKDVAAAGNTNDGIYRSLAEAVGFGPPSYDRECRFAVRKLDGGVVNMVRETSYTTRWGLFGYNEHELINREFTLCRDLDDLTLLYPGGSDPSVLLKFQPQRVPAAIIRLVKELRAPADASRIELLRMSPAVLDAVDLVALIEDLAHKEIGIYLGKVDGVRKAGADDEETLNKIRSVEMPVLIHELKRGGDGGFFVCIPGGLAFPRPKVMPDVQNLLEEYRGSVDGQGGMALYQRQAAGRIDVASVHSTDALATLVRTVGNRLVEKYLSQPEEMRRVQQAIHTELDQEAWRHPTITVNATWEFLPQNHHAFEVAPAAREEVPGRFEEEPVAPPAEAFPE